MQDMPTLTPTEPDEHSLDLPVLVVKHKKQGDDKALAKGANQMRLYLTACVKFLDAVGIKNFVVYGMLTDGPHVTFPAAVMNEAGVCVSFFDSTYAFHIADVLQ